MPVAVFCRTELSKTASFLVLKLCMGRLRMSVETEHGMPHNAGLAFHQSEHNRLRSVLEEAHNGSRLPTQPSCLAGVKDLLIRLRLHFDR